MSLRGRCSFARSNPLALRRLLRRRSTPPRNDIVHNENSTSIQFFPPFIFSRLLRLPAGTNDSSHACACYAGVERVAHSDSFSTRHVDANLTRAADVDSILHTRTSNQHTAADICIHGNIITSTDIAASIIENAIHIVCLARLLRSSTCRGRNDPLYESNRRCAQRIGDGGRTESSRRIRARKYSAG